MNTVLVLGSIALIAGAGYVFWVVWLVIIQPHIDSERESEELIRGGGGDR